MQQAVAINQRDTGEHDEEEFPTGQNWKIIAPPQVPFRKVYPITIDSTAAPNTQTINLGFDPTGYVFTKIMATIGDNSAKWIPLPFSGADQTVLYVSGTDIVIENTTNSFDGYTGYCILEYIKA